MYRIKLCNVQESDETGHDIILNLVRPGSIFLLAVYRKMKFETPTSGEEIGHMLGNLLR